MCGIEIGKRSYKEFSDEMARFESEKLNNLTNHMNLFRSRVIKTTVYVLL